MVENEYSTMFAHFCDILLVKYIVSHTICFPEGIFDVLIIFCHILAWVLFILIGGMCFCFQGCTFFSHAKQD